MMRITLPDAVGYPSSWGSDDAKTGMVPEETSGPVRTVFRSTEPVEPLETPVCVGPISHVDRHEDGLKRLSQARRIYELRSAGVGVVTVGQIVGVSPATVSRLYRQAVALGDEGMTAEAFAPGRPGPARRRAFTEPELASARALALLHNRTATAGSPTEALRKMARKGELRPELAEELAERDAAGKPLLTRSMRRDLHLGEATVRAFRNPREAWLEYVSSPGSIHFTRDDDGFDRMIEPGEAWTIDDGTINLACCVPTGDPSWRHGVMVGRFQFLLVVDHRSYFIPGWSYTARPRGSYRAEDLVATLHNTMVEHGMPKWLVLEKGISASHLVTRMCELAGMTIHRAQTPHEKVVEMVFGCLWTKLSDLPGQVGRFQGEEAEVTALIESCRNGAKDPRKHFPMLGDVLKALQSAVTDWNSHHVNGSRWGRWQPSEYWTRASSQHLRKVAAADDWMFAPRITEPLKVRGMTIATSVLMAPGFSQQFTFGDADWLAQWIGATVRLHFNPFGACADAKAVLATPFAGERAGLVLGDLRLVDQQARFTRKAWGYATDTDIGGAAVKRAAHALHRSVVAVRPDGKPGVMAVEQRDGLMRQGPGQDGFSDIPKPCDAMTSRAPSGTRHGQAPVETGNDRANGRGSGRVMDPQLAEFFEEEESYAAQMD